MTLNELEERAIAAALTRFNNNRTRAARALGISVRTLQRKLGAKNAADDGSLGDEPADGGPAGPADAAPAPAPDSLVGSSS